ncbi:Trichostatin A-insensitive homodimeric histone deacetylase [Anopheles sinensis]|uniref:Trichostatin A-insensitive homodimeric histone deacetylase n=1 Tax=Anopheles sinensis TaxID=74873 RepID=A0A084WPT8_ANOSI|nr:Trichostatin A-insensitive homodimeric histone deacetylase [Anopheles sinensis]
MRGADITQQTTVAVRRNTTAALRMLCLGIATMVARRRRVDPSSWRRWWRRHDK